MYRIDRIAATARQGRGERQRTNGRMDKMEATAGERRASLAS
jgi:hypothetical protein